MARIRLIHWNGPEGRERKLRLAGLGYEAEFQEPNPGQLRGWLRANPPDAYVIDLSRLPSGGREVAMWLRTYKDTRHIPIVFVDGDPDKVAKLKTLLPDATYTTWGRMKTALPRAIARPPKNPFVPPSHIYTGKPTAEKLGIKSGFKVCLLNAPKGFAEALKPMPEKVTLTAKADPRCDLFLMCVRTPQDVAISLGQLGKVVDRQTVWIAWTKQASGKAAAANGNTVRETGLASGWVDFKVCSIDDTWSGLAFKRRK